MTMPLRVAVLAKQVPRFEDLHLGPGGRLLRDGGVAEINPYCRRAIAKGVELARVTSGSCTVFTLGPPHAADVLAEAIAWGADDGVLVSGAAFAGSDTLATSRALAAAISRSGPFGLILAGLNTVDGETGQVGPQLAELLDLPFLSGVREITLDGDRVTARCERDDGFVTAALRLPALITAAERLCAPCKVPPAARGESGRGIRVVTAADLGAGPWGQAGSPTAVGEVRTLAHDRSGVKLSGPIEAQVAHAADLIRQATQRLPRPAAAEQVPLTGGDGPTVAVIAEPGRPRSMRELLGAAATLAARLRGRTILLTVEPPDAVLAWAYGADNVVAFDTGTDLATDHATPVAARAGTMAPIAEDVATAVASWAQSRPFFPGEQRRLPWAILAPSSPWGREVAGRASVLLAAGLTGDAIGLEVADGRLVCWKPALGGQLVAAITARSAIQMATVRPGVLPLLQPRSDPGMAVVRRGRITPGGRVAISEHIVNDEPERLWLAASVVCVGVGVDPARYGELEPLLKALGAELAGTRKVTDAGWLPRSRQVGITGRAIAPAVYLLLGASGKFNHMAGSRGAGLVLAVNADPAAPVFEAADVGIVADWALVAPLLARELSAPTSLGVLA
jgi:electron transfer flavoprotein alpha subunit